MNAPLDLQQPGAQALSLNGGTMEAWVDPAVTGRVGLAIVLHPQPLMGGHARHKVPDYLAKGLVAHGWTVVRPNFRGVGGSSGVHDEGRGESEDVLALVTLLRHQHPGERVALIGFSFGAFVAACVASRLASDQKPAWRVCLTGMPHGEVAGGRRYDTPTHLPDALVVHGERDEQVPLAQVFEWAGPATQPVVVVPGADHFFSARLPVLRGLVLRHLQTSSPTL